MPYNLEKFGKTVDCDKCIHFRGGKTTPHVCNISNERNYADARTIFCGGDKLTPHWKCTVCPKAEYGDGAFLETCETCSKRDDTPKRKQGNNDIYYFCPITNVEVSEGTYACKEYEFSKVNGLDICQHCKGFLGKGINGVCIRSGSTIEAIHPQCESFIKGDSGYKSCIHCKNYSTETGLCIIHKNNIEAYLGFSCKEKKDTSSGGCYVATAIYGDYDAPEVLILREYRDSFLIKSTFGRLFISTYYAISPLLVKHLINLKWINLQVKKILEFFIERIKRNKKSCMEDKT